MMDLLVCTLDYNYSVYEKSPFPLKQNDRLFSFNFYSNFILNFWWTTCFSPMFFFFFFLGGGGGSRWGKVGGIKFQFGHIFCWTAITLWALSSNCKQVFIPSDLYSLNVTSQLWREKYPGNNGNSSFGTSSSSNCDPVTSLSLSLCVVQFICIELNK